MRFACRSNNRRGSLLIYGLVAITALIGFASLAVDLGRVQLAKTELLRSADAAARAAAAELPRGPAAAQAAAISYASSNKSDESSVTLLSSDIELGNWNTSNRTFTVLSGASQNSATAVRITARKSTARGTAVPLFFGKILGVSSCDLSVQVISSYSGGDPSGFIGLEGASFGNNTFVGSYNSAVTTSPNQTTASFNGAIGSNGAIAGGNNSVLRGDAVLGPSGSIAGFTVTGAQISRSSAIVTPTSATWNPSPNPGGVAQNFSATGNQTLPGGTYWFTAISIGNNDSLSFSGPATIYLNGSPAFGNGATINAYQNIPSNLKIYVIGSGDFGDAEANNLSITARIEAPNSALKAKNNLLLRGSGVFKSIDTKNNTEIFYDEAEGSAIGVAKVSSVK